MHTHANTRALTVCDASDDLDKGNAHDH